MDSNTELYLIRRRMLTDGMLKEQIRSVNLHITKACNYKCEFCFARFEQVSTHLQMEQWMKIITLLTEAGAEKVTFVGGEPTLVPYLPDLVQHAKELGLTTMVVTNGTKMSKEYIKKFEGKLDWVGLSIDSAKEEISAQLGRGDGNHVKQTIEVCERLKKEGIKIKVNSVVTKLTWKEDMSWLIKRLNPIRWKVFQMLPIKGENDGTDNLTISEEEFNHFIEAHKDLSPVKETNDDMIESYVMIDPEGRFYTNKDNRLTHGISILEYGVKKAFEAVDFKLEKFVERGGIYTWGDQA